MMVFNLFSKSNREATKQEKSYRSEKTASHIYEDSSNPSQKAIIYQSELDYMSRCILDYPNIETGGQLFGFWTATGVPVVMYVIGPGKNAQHNPTSFVQDQRYLQTAGNELHKRFRLQHIGEWHSHHQLGLAHPSGGDLDTMQYGVGKPGFPRLLLCIGNCTRTHTTVNPFNFHENTPRDYSQAVWDIVDMESPFRNIADRELSSILIHPHTLRASHGELRTVRNAVQETATHKIHWLTEAAENVDTMKAFVSIVQTMYPNYSVKAEVIATGEPLISLGEIKISIKLPYGFPVKSPVLVSGGKDKLPAANVWEVSEEPLTATFARWVGIVLPSFLSVECQESARKMDLEENVYGTLRQEPLTQTEKMEIRQAKDRTERLGIENQLLSEYFHDSAFAWSEITGTPVVNIVAYPFTNNCQGVIRMTMAKDFPETPPKIQFGYYKEDSTSLPTLPENLAKIEYRPLSDLFDNANKVYCKLLRWTSETSIFRSYIVACLMLYYYNKSQSEHRDINEYLNQLIEDENRLNEQIKMVNQKIREYKL